MADTTMTTVSRCVPPTTAIEAVSDEHAAYAIGGTHQETVSAPASQKVNVLL